MSEENNEAVQDLFLGLDKSQLGTILAVSSVSERFNEIIQSDQVNSAFLSLREEYKGKTVEEQLQYILTLKRLCLASSQISIFASNLCGQVEDALISGLIAEQNKNSVSE